MWTVLIKFVLGNWKSFLVGGVVAIVVGWAALHYQGLHTEIAKLETKVAELKQENAEYKTTNTDLNDLINEQNQRIVAINSDRDRMTIELNEARKEVGNIENEYESRIEEILNSDTPEDCEGAFEWMVDYASERNNEKSK